MSPVDPVPGLSQVTGRLLVDVSSLLRWTGSPVGIARVQHALATAARRRPDAVLTYYDSAANRFHAISPAWRTTLLGWSGALDTHQPGPPRRGFRALVPGRQPLVAALERMRLTRAPPIDLLAALAQRALLAIRPHGFLLFDAEGRRFANVPRDMALGDDLRPGPVDTVLTVGSGWSDRDPARFAALIREAGFRHVTLCYDLIPVTHARFYDPDVAADFAAYWRGILPVTARVVVNAACIAADLRGFCAAKGVAVPDIVILPLGHDPPGAAAPTLPAGLLPGRYALFVSTIEPRKGHALLLRVWRRLLARGIPQRAKFTLVLVGRPGWMVDSVLADLAEPAAFAGTVLHLSSAGDAVREALLRKAAFCLYPSIYEGFGLPIVEAFAREKAVLASNGGALAETVGALSPQLDPEDEDAWAAALADWIERPAARAPYEAMLRAGTPFPDWETAATRILDAAVA